MTSLEINDPAKENEELDAKTHNNIYRVCRTVIPQVVWASKDFIYVGLEIYLPRPDARAIEDWRFAAEIVKSILKCDESLRNNLPD